MAKNITKLYDDKVNGYRQARSAKENGGYYLSGYYYGFEPTGIGIIDEILQAVAIAGKSYHSTDEWTEGSYDEDKISMEQIIQEAADRAAKTL